MSFLDTFTEALVQKQMKEDGLQRGYTVQASGRVYQDYLNDQTSWKQLISNMSQEHYNEYENGSGGELMEKDGRPPKMAAFASSSRMIYMLSKDIPEFHFEEQLPTTVGGIANMDGYRAKDGNYVFVEAKCREPYGHSIMEAYKQKYKEIYSYLRDKMPRVFSCVMEDIPENKMNVVFFCHNRVVEGFDIKQMISHLLGVATKFLKQLNDGELDVKHIQFLYLLYNPTDLQIAEPNQTKIMHTYIDTCRCAVHYHFEEMFGHVVDFLAPTLCPTASSEQLQAIKSSFHFELCDQSNYNNFF